MPLIDYAILGAGGVLAWNAPLLARSFSSLFNDMTNINPLSAIDIETVSRVKSGTGNAGESHDFLASKDGSLGFMIEIFGNTVLVGAEERTNIRINLSRGLKSLMETPGVIVQMSFQRDPHNSSLVSRRWHAPLRDTAHRLGLKIDDVIASNEADLAKRIEDEWHYWTVWVTPYVLAKKIRADASKRRASLMKAYPQAADTQKVIGAMEELRDRVYGVRKSFETELRIAGLDFRFVPARESIKIMREAVDPSMAGGFEPVLPEDPLPKRISPTIEDDFLHNRDNPGRLLWPSLATQILPESPTLPAPNIVAIGNRMYATFSVRLLPSIDEDIQKLLVSMSSGESVPWRISIRMEGGGPSIMGFRSNMAKLLSFDPTTPVNKQIVAAADIVDRRSTNDVSQVKVQVDLCTWADIGDHETLHRRVETLISAYQTIGGAQVERYSNRSWLGFLETCPGVRIRSGSNMSCLSLFECFGMAPLSRPSSPWMVEPSSMLFRSGDGKVLPFQPGSSLLSAQVTLVSGPMGFGKSVAMMDYCLSLALKPGETEWPYISFLDIGPGSSGLVSLIKSGLPEDKKDLAQYIMLDRDPDLYGINMLDTPLGWWTPSPEQKSRIINLISLLAPDAENQEAFFEAVITKAYEKVAPVVAGGSPKKYSPNVEVEIDLKIRQYIDDLREAYGFDDVRELAWWDLVDFFFMKNEEYAALRAQTYAVPSIKEITGVPLDEDIRQIYKNVTVAGRSEGLPEYVNRALLEAVRLYPHICGPTKIVTGRSRIIAINLDRVCPKGSGAAMRETAIMSLVAQEFASGSWKSDFDHLDLIRRGFDPEKKPMPLVQEYRKYHRKRIEQLKKVRKLLVIDENHRYKGIHHIEKQQEIHVREGRKFSFDILLGSQSIDDYNDKILDLATVVLIMGAGSLEAATKVCQKYQLNPTTTMYVKNRLLKAGSNGSNMVAIYTTSRGRFAQFQYLSRGPVELWGVQSNPPDVNLRNKLYENLGEPRARQILSKKFPLGTAEDYLAQIRKKMGRQVSASGENEIPEEVIDQVANSLIEEASKNV